MYRVCMRRLKFLFYLIALACIATPSAAQEARTAVSSSARYPLETDDSMRVWETNQNFINLVEREISRRIGPAPTLINHNNVDAIIKSSWVDRAGDIVILYSPAYRIFILIQYDSDLSTEAKYVRITTIKEAFEFLNPTGVVKRSELDLLGRFVDGVALVTLWQAMARDGISPLPSFLQYYDGFIDVSAYDRIVDIRTSIVPVWERLIRSNAAQCFAAFIDGVENSRPGDIFRPFVDLGLAMTPIDYLNSDNDSKIMILADTQFARIHTFVFVDKSCAVTNLQVRAFQ